ncbi:MAG: hypothetical protein EOP06_21325 [Proteobacteria bacterium]|nr:MAG: hypothetical protein EOP06_21325 [Pseudomonadota bacterium]
MRNQTRSDSKAGYIDPLPPRDNLVILTGQQVTKVNFNGTTDANGNIVAGGVTASILAEIAGRPFRTCQRNPFTCASAAGFIKSAS